MQRRPSIFLAASVCLLIATTTVSRAGFTQSLDLAFEVAAIKPSQPGENGWKMQFTVDGFTAQGVELRKVIQEAYGIYEEDRLYGGPSWVNTSRFDIEARIDDAGSARFKELSLPERRAMLQSLLSERFKLILRHETKDLPVFALAIAKNGPRLKEAASNPVHDSGVKGYSALITHSQLGELDVQNCSMSDLASLLNDRAGRNVQDMTHLTGRYDLSLRWKPENDSALTESPWPSLFTALQEQLGLRLEPAKLPVDTLVVDHVELPSEN